MRTSPSSLPEHLNKGLSRIYHLFCGEILLAEEALDLIRQTAKSAGFDESERFTVETGFDWNHLRGSTQTMSLFSNQRLIELRIPNGKPGKEGSLALSEFVESLPDDTLLVVISGPIDKRSQGSKWFNALENAGTVIDCAAIPVAQLPEWISNRMRTKGLSFDNEAVQRLAYYVEGNLLAAAQEINLLALLADNREITESIVEESIADHARFNVYTYVDACLSGSAHRGTRILHSLKREQAEPVIILWALARDARTLCQLLAAMDQGKRLESITQKFGVWGNRVGLFRSATKHLNLNQSHSILRRLARADLMVKGKIPFQKKNIWEEIENIGLALSGVRIC